MLCTRHERAEDDCKRSQAWDQGRLHRLSVGRLRRLSVHGAAACFGAHEPIIDLLPSEPESRGAGFWDKVGSPWLQEKTSSKMASTLGICLKNAGGRVVVDGVDSKSPNSAAVAHNLWLRPGERGAA